MRMNRALGLGLLSLTTLLACVPDPVTPPTMSEGSQLSAITAERLQGCMTEYGQQLDGQSRRVQATVKVDQDGRVVDAVIDGLPLSAPDLAACARVTLREMAVPESVLRLRPTEPPISQQQSAPARGLMGNILVLGGAIALGEIVAKAFGVTLIFAVAVEIVDVARKRPRQKPPEDRTCTEHLTECLLSAMADEPGSVWNHSRCKMCFDRCQGPASNNKWPQQIQLDEDVFASCQYWKPGSLQ